MEPTARPPLTRAEHEFLALALPDAHRLAGRIARQCPNLTLDEVKAIAEDELLAGLRSFDVSRNDSLFIYTRLSIEGRILRASRRRALDMARRTVRPTRGGARAMAAIAAFGETLEEVPVSDLTLATAEDLDAELTALGAAAGDAARFGMALADDDAAPPDVQSARRKLREDLAAAMSQEDDEIVALVIAIVLDDATWEVAAGARGMSVSTAQRRTKKAFDRLRARLSALGHG